VLPIVVQNDLHIENFKIIDKQFQSFRNNHSQLHDITTLVPESNKHIKGSYAMVDPVGRFYDNASIMCNLKGQHKPNRQTNLKRTIKHILAIFSLTFLISSCNKTTPAGFWTDFHKDYIIAKNSDQGPSGGRIEIHWKCETNNSFTNKELIEFADKNDWKLIDSISFSADTLTKNSFSNQKIDDYSLDILNESILPKLKSKDSKLFIFKTTWLNVEPGNARETFENVNQKSVLVTLITAPTS
jgi:hypothetical protein